MGYYLPPKSYLRPKPKVKTKQKFIAITTASITIIAVAVIFTTLHFADNKSVLADTNSNKEKSEVVIQEPLINPTIATLEKTQTINFNFPVQLAYFKIVKNLHSVDLKWSTTLEYKNEFYTVEKSVNGSGFYEIGCVESKKENSLSSDYVFTDNIISEGVIFYRLRQTSSNERSTYIALEKVILKNDNEDLSLYIEGIGPEPFDNYFNINYYTDREGGISVELFDKMGKKIYKTYTEATQGYNTCRFIEGDKLTDAVYTLRIANSSGAFVKKIRKKV